MIKFFNRHRNKSEPVTKELHSKNQKSGFEIRKKLIPDIGSGQKGTGSRIRNTGFIHKLPYLQKKNKSLLSSQ
jgi:hypothetical protein